MQVLGHRGSPGFPRFGENTRTSFHKALESGADGFELDVRRCGDGTLVVLHDATLNRTTNGSGHVHDLPYDTLSRFDAGHGDRVPRLSDILDEFGKQCTIHIELKEAGLIEDVVNQVTERDLASQVVVSAFDFDDCAEDSSSTWVDLASVISKVSTALLITSGKLRRMSVPAFIDTAKMLGAPAIHIRKDSVTTSLVGLAKQADLKTRVWTVNSRGLALALRDLGVDAIFTDCPERCLKVLT